MLRKTFIMLLACSAFLPFAGEQLSAAPQEVNAQTEDVAWWNRGWGWGPGRNWYGGGWNRWNRWNNWNYPYQGGYGWYNNPWYYT